MKIKEAEEEFISELKGHPKTKQLTFLEGVGMLVGTNIGVGILSIANTAKQAGFFPLLIWLVIAGILSTITMLYIAEATLRTKSQLQLTGLSVKYIGPIAKYVMFFSVLVTSLGALVAYEKASGDIINSIFKIPNYLGSIIFFFPAALILWLGLKAIGRGEKQIVGIMFIILIILIISTLLKSQTNFGYLLEANWKWKYSMPIFNVVVFVYSSQYIIPEMARGFAHKPELLPKSIITGTIITFCMLMLVPMSAIIIEGLDKISPVVTISWGKAIGEWAYMIANLFALCAVLTSYWGLGGMFITNIGDQLNIDVEKNLKNRFWVLLCVVLPPIALVLLGFVSSVDQALYWPGVVGALVLSFFPIWILSNARKYGDKQTQWQCSPIITNIFVKILIIAVYLLATLGSVSAHYNLGWI